jgi:hypothetical protein
MMWLHRDTGGLSSHALPSWGCHGNAPSNINGLEANLICLWNSSRLGNADAIWHQRV